MANYQRLINPSNSYELNNILSKVTTGPCSFDESGETILNASRKTEQDKSK